MRGTVLFVDLKSDSGVAAGDDGKRYGFSLQSCPAGAPPVGARVDFEIRENAAADVYVLHTPFAAKLDWLFWFLFSWRGRVSRDQMIAFFACAVLFLPVFAVCATWSGIPSFSTAGGVLATYVFLSVAVKRFHDSGASAFWLALTAFLSVLTVLIVARVLNLPFIGTAAVYGLLAFTGLAAVFCVYLCFAKGAVGENAYGAQPYSCRTVRLK